MGSDIEEGKNAYKNKGGLDHSKQKRKRRPKQRNNGSSFFVIPSEVVCTAGSSDSNVVEWGVIVSMGVLCLFLVGCFQTANYLPTPVLGPFGVSSQIHPTRDSPVIVEEIDSVAQEAQPAVERKMEKEIVIPEAHWPVSIRTEDESTYDSLTHPGDGQTVMKVPRFWSPPVHQNKLMSRETAMKIGSCAVADSDGSHNRGDDCPVDQRTIHVAIASYRDFECRSTVESIFNRAKNPERIRVGVVDQIVHDEDAICNAPIEPCSEKPEQALCKFADQVDVYEMAAELSIGPVYARHIGYRLYRGEYYATQSDAHVTYTQNWDADIIQQLEDTQNEMGVLSTYLTDVQGSISETGQSLRNTRPIMCNTRYEGGAQGMHLRHGSQPECIPVIRGMSQLQPWWAAGYSFSRGHFVVNVPYDWNSAMIFQGEEMSIGIRGFTIGYDYYAPERSVCFHHYAVGKNARVRNKVHHFWENDNKYAGTGKKAMQRLLGLVRMNPEVPSEDWDHVDEDIYGVGGVRTPEKFYETFGIDVVNKTVEGHLCRFVNSNGLMHKKFTPLLRKDGMGIDYSRVLYKFKDPAPNEK